MQIRKKYDTRKPLCLYILKSHCSIYLILEHFISAETKLSDNSLTLFLKLFIRTDNTNVSQHPELPHSIAISYTVSPSENNWQVFTNTSLGFLH